jgi:hypothetical protein
MQGATDSQARAALQQYKDVMQAAEQFFEGKFDHIRDDDVEMSAVASKAKSLRPVVCLLSLIPPLSSPETMR